MPIGRGLDFSGSDLRGFDFTGARLVGCKFGGALIEGARFDQAEIDHAGFTAERRTALRTANDWETYVKEWRKAVHPPQDDHLATLAVFQDAPNTPEMVIVPGGSFVMGASFEERRQFDPKDDNTEEQRIEITGIPRFAVSRYVVTCDEWAAFIADGGRDMFEISGRQPWTVEKL